MRAGDHYLTTADIMAVTGLGKSTVNRLLREGQIPARTSSNGNGRQMYLVKDEDLLLAMEAGVLPSPRNAPRRIVKAPQPAAPRPAPVSRPRELPRLDAIALTVSAVALVAAVAAIVLAVAS